MAGTPVWKSNLAGTMLDGFGIGNDCDGFVERENGELGYRNPLEWFIQFNSAQVKSVISEGTRVFVGDDYQYIVYDRVVIDGTLEIDGIGVVL